MTIDEFAHLENKLALRRSAVLFITLWMTWRAFAWAALFAQATDMPGLDAAAIIGAVTAPITYLQAAAFKSYIDSKGES